MTWTTTDSPIGELTLVADADDALVGVYMAEHARRPDTSGFGARTSADRAPFARAAEQLREYFAGERRRFELPTAAVGTAFQRAVWEQLAALPYATTVTYAQLAERVGNPRAVRAVGLANGRNPLSLVVPCHRVVGASGSLTGFAGGVERKRFLLELEARTAGADGQLALDATG